MFANITSFTKNRQPKEYFWFSYSIKSSENRFAYEGDISFSFYQNSLTGLYLKKSKYKNNADENLVNLALNWLKDEKKPMDIILFGTEFQVLVWQALTKIPTGTSVTYSDIAKKINRPKAVRAVGTAIGKNPISLIIPCHRVVNKDKNKENYGWGVEIKRKILEFEKNFSISI